MLKFGMAPYYVVSKSEGWRQFCTGPDAAQARLERLVKEGKKRDDLTIEMVVEEKLPPSEKAPKRITKQRYKLGR
jgi:hypothetical protein